MRIPYVLTLLGGVAALHFLMAACGGGESGTSTAQAGTGGAAASSGSGTTAGTGSGVCECSKSRVDTATCMMPPGKTVLVARLDVPGKSAQELYGTRAYGVAKFGNPFKTDGAAYVEFPIAIGDGFMIVDCIDHKSSMPNVDVVDFVLPPGI